MTDDNVRVLKRPPNENAVEAAKRVLARARSGQLRGFLAMGNSDEGTFLTLGGGESGNVHEEIGFLMNLIFERLMDTHHDTRDQQDISPEEMAAMDTEDTE